MKPLLVSILAVMLPMTSVLAESIPALIEQLGAAEHAQRHAAQEQLFLLCTNQLEQVSKACAAACKTTTDPEVRARTLELLNRIFDEHILNRPRGFLGAQLQATELENQPGKLVVVVQQVIPSSAAESAGIQKGDLIVQFDGSEPPADFPTEWLVSEIQGRSPGTEVSLLLKREGEPLKLTVPLGEMPTVNLRLLALPARRDELFEKWHTNLLKQSAPKPPPTSTNPKKRQNT
jgi:predicted metalloprotease with PDZ domain